MSGAVKLGEYVEGLDHRLIDCRTGGIVPFADIESPCQKCPGHTPNPQRAYRENPPRPTDLRTIRLDRHRNSASVSRYIHGGGVDWDF